MTPRLSDECVMHRGSVDAVDLGERSDRLSLGMSQSCFDDDLSGESGVRELFSNSLTMSASHVSGIVGIGARTQIVWIDVLGEVVGMQDLQPWWDGSDKQFVRHSVSEVFLATMPDDSVSTFVQNPSPQPRHPSRRRIFWHDREESVSEARMCWWHGGETT